MSKINTDRIGTRDGTLDIDVKSIMVRSDAMENLGDYEQGIELTHAHEFIVKGDSWYTAKTGQVPYVLTGVWEYDKERLEIYGAWDHSSLKNRDKEGSHSAGAITYAHGSDFPDNSVGKEVQKIINNRKADLEALRTDPIALDGVTVTGRLFTNDMAYQGYQFVWDDTSTVPDNNGTVISNVNSGVGRYVLKYVGPVDCRWYGADPSGNIDSTLAIQAALDNHMDVHLSRGIYLTSDTLTVRSEQSFEGTPHTTITNLQDAGVILKLDPPLGGNYVENITVKNLKLLGREFNDGATPITSIVGLEINPINGSRLNIEEIEIRKVHTGLKAGRSWTNSFKRIGVYSSHIAYDFSTQFNNTTLHDCHATNCFIHIDSVYSEGLLFNNFLSQNSSNPNPPIYARYSTLTFINPYFEGTAGIAVNGSSSEEETRRSFLTIIGGQCNSPRLLVHRTRVGGFSITGLRSQNMKATAIVCRVESGEYYVPISSECFELNYGVPAKLVYSMDYKNLKSWSRSTLKRYRDYVEYEPTTLGNSSTVFSGLEVGKQYTVKFMSNEDGVISPHLGGTRLRLDYKAGVEFIFTGEATSAILVITLSGTPTKLIYFKVYENVSLTGSAEPEITGQYFSESIPTTTESWRVGDVVYNSKDAHLGVLGWSFDGTNWVTMNTGLPELP